MVVVPVVPGDQLVIFVVNPEKEIGVFLAQPVFIKSPDAIVPALRIDQAANILVSVISVLFGDFPKDVFPVFLRGVGKKAVYRHIRCAVNGEKEGYRKQKKQNHSGDLGSSAFDKASHNASSSLVQRPLTQRAALRTEEERTKAIMAKRKRNGKATAAAR